MVVGEVQKVSFDANFQKQIDHRQTIFEKHIAEKNRKQAELLDKKIPIKVSLPNGSARDCFAYQDSPFSVAQSISKSLANQAIIAKVNGKLWEIEKPLESDCSLELLKFDHPEAQQVFWHSSAHILGEALEQVFGCHLCYGPPIASGFYYDMFIGDLSVTHDQFEVLESLVKKIIKEKQPFESLELTVDQLKDMFNYNKFKCEIIDTKVKTPSTTVYRCGSLIDLCPGPHIKHTGIVKALKIMNSSSSFWLGDAKRESLQRVYGLSFPSQKQLDAHLELLEEQKKRNHIKIGTNQHLWHFNPEKSPGSCFYEPNGQIIYNRLLNMLRRQYRMRGFKEVQTPNLYKLQLFDQSGHLEHYEKNMFTIQGESKEKINKLTDCYGVKPMNCPGHCLLFDSKYRTHREMPLRFAEFGICHRNEASGALSGLTRVIRFTQDDAHIFCELDQVHSEIEGCIDFFKFVYGKLGFEFSLELSTRPEGFLGKKEVWDKAESELESCLNKSFGKNNWKLNPGDGAFYGPKIDIHVKDALKKCHQLATIQLDFNLPERFNLFYVGKDTKKHSPVIIHRAILGSLERSLGVMAEHFGGKWPLWLSPFQICIIPITLNHEEHVDKVIKQIKEFSDYDWCIHKMHADSSVNARVRSAQLQQFNFICVVGKKEMQEDSLNIRTRDGEVHGRISVSLFVNVVKAMIENLELNSDSSFKSYIAEFENKHSANALEKSLNEIKVSSQNGNH